MPACLTANHATATVEGSVGGISLLTVVVPCHNEAESLPRLFFELNRLESALAADHALEFLFVDDGSQDSTWEMLQSHASAKANVRLARHAHRRGIAAALTTGIRQAQGDVVASLDADCTYEPLMLARCLPLLTSGVDVVVASPYHPAGAVVGVTAWRLALSRMASGCYRSLMRNKLHTYTSCVRVCRKSAVADVTLANDGFVGVVELLWRVDRRGGSIVECPATLHVRQAGQSKMRLLRTTLSHVRFLIGAALAMVIGRGESTRRPTANVPHSVTPHTF